MDPREERGLRLEKIRLGVVGTVEVAGLQARRDTALMAVLLTLAGTALVGGAAGQVAFGIALPCGLALVACAAFVGLRMRRLAADVKRAVAGALQDIDSLMRMEVELDGDGEEADAR